MRNSSDTEPQYKEKENRGYPVNDRYKYLGTRMNKELYPMVHLEETRKKLNV